MKWLNMIGEWQRRGLGLTAAGLSLLGGLFSLSGCGSPGPATATDPDAAGTQPEPGDSTADPAALPSDRSPATPSASGTPAMAATTPSKVDGASEAAPLSGDQWLEEQVRLAAKLRQAGDYPAEAAHWDQVVATLDRSIGPGNWITAGARLSRQVAKQLAGFTPQQRERWRSFEGLEAKFLQNRREMEELRGGGRIAPEQYVNATKEQLEILGQQAAVIQDLFGQPSHLLANIAYHQAETLMAVEQWVPAFVAAEKCLSQRQAVIQVRHPDTIAALKIMGQIAQQMNNLGMAEDCLLKATQAAEQVWGSQNVMYAAQANDLGVYYYWAETQKSSAIHKDYSKANFWLERGLQLRRELLGDSHALVAISRRNYALSKMAEATSKPSDRQALDLALANALISDALQSLRASEGSTSPALLLQVASEAATIKMLLHEYSEAESLLGEIATRWREHPDSTPLPISPATLFYRWGLAQARQKSPTKLASAEKLMEQAIRLGATAPGDAKTVAAARQALDRLQSLAGDEPQNLIAGRPDPAGGRSAVQPEVTPGNGALPVRVVALPAIEDQ
jgi:hypothetical protein